jgi:hypothetical protein
MKASLSVLGGSIHAFGLNVQFDIYKQDIFAQLFQSKFMLNYISALFIAIKGVASCVAR